ncbi:MAG: hypothetical protein U0744_10980 [Gemmataceae bacterium]
MLLALAIAGLIAKTYRVFFEDRTIQVPPDFMDRVRKESPEFKKAMADLKRNRAKVEPQQQFAAEFVQRIRQGEFARAHACLTPKLQADLPREAFEKEIASAPWFKEPRRGILFMSVHLDDGTLIDMALESGNAGSATIGVETMPGGHFAVGKFELRNKE